MSYKPTIAIDFDGVIHKYSKGWQDGSIYDEPVEGVFEAMQKLLENHTLFIHSTRNPRQIKRWLKKYIIDEEPHPFGLPELVKIDVYGYRVQVIPFWKKFWNKKSVIGITRRKLPAIAYIDDRAVKFDGNWNKIFQSLTPKENPQKRDKVGCMG